MAERKRLDSNRRYDPIYKETSTVTAYTIEEDDVAFILTPKLDKDGKWNGMLQSAVATHPETILDDPTMSRLIELITLISAFIDVVQEDQYVYDTVSERRDELLEEVGYGVDDDDEEDYEVVEGTDNKVIKLTRFTKTEGSA